MLKALFTRLPFEWQVGLLWAGRAAIVAAALGAYGWVDHQGYQRATLEWTVKYDKREAELNQQRIDEVDRQASINAMAKAAEMAEIAAYQEELAARAKLIMRLEEEAAADPEGDRLALDAEAVQRYNRRIAR